ncbi:MAG: hypothetical protein RRY29_10780 [Desulfovibrionaceae bacterium]
MTTSIWTYEELTSLIAAYKAAYAAASTGKSYALDGRNLTRQDIPEILRQLDYLSGELASLSGQKRGPVFVQCRVRR